MKWGATQFTSPNLAYFLNYVDCFFWQCKLKLLKSYIKCWLPFVSTSESGTEVRLFSESEQIRTSLPSLSYLTIPSVHLLHISMFVKTTDKQKKYLILCKY